MNWQEYTVEDLAAKTSNAIAMGPFGSRIKKENFVEAGVPIIRGVNLSEGRFNAKEFVFLTNEKADELRASNVFPNDLVFTHRGTLGQVGLVPDNLYPRYVASQSQMKMTCDTTQVLPLFLYYYFCADGMTELLKHTGGSGVPAISSPSTTLRNLKVRIPPLATQRRIAAVLSAYDDLIENNARRIAILEELARTLYREWFVHLRFPGHERVAVVDGVPEGWQVVRATDAIEINPTMKVPRDGLKPFLPMSSLSENSMLISEIEYREGNSGAKFKNGDTLFARITPCLENGKTGFVQFLPSNDAVGFGSTEFIVLRSRSLCPEMVYLLARSNGFRDNAIKSMSGATGRQRVQEECFESFLLAQPDTRTIELFREHTASIFKSIQLLARKNANLRRTRDLLLPRLVSGELDVSELEIAGAVAE